MLTEKVWKPTITTIFKQLPVLCYVLNKYFVYITVNFLFIFILGVSFFNDSCTLASFKES